MGDWQLDPYHTQVEFSAKHLAMMTVRGYFDELSAIADIDPAPSGERRSVEVTISTASIRTNNGIRDNDLRSSNFLEVDKYPVITFKSTGVQTVDADHYTLNGDLTIKGNTRPNLPRRDQVRRVQRHGDDGAPDLLRRSDQDQQEGLRPGNRPDPGRPGRRQRGDPDHHRRRLRRAEAGRRGPPAA